jgi:hypothetical protein
MLAYLAVVSPQSSEPVQGTGGQPIDLTDQALPTSAYDKDATRLLTALERATREMSIRQRQSPAGATELRLGLITATDAGTGMDATVADLDLRTVDFDDASDREAVLEAMRELEREMLSGG